jgi:hypothetical protein
MTILNAARRELWGPLFNAVILAASGLVVGLSVALWLKSPDSPILLAVIMVFGVASNLAISVSHSRHQRLSRSVTDFRTSGDAEVTVHAAPEVHSHWDSDEVRGWLKDQLREVAQRLGHTHRRRVVVYVFLRREDVAAVFGAGCAAIALPEVNAMVVAADDGWIWDSVRHETARTTSLCNRSRSSGVGTSPARWAPPPEYSCNSTPANAGSPARSGAITSCSFR